MQDEADEDAVTSFCPSTISNDSLQRSCTFATGSSLESPARNGRWVGKKSSPPLKRGKTRGTTQSELRNCAEKWNFCRSSTTHQLQLQKSPDIISFMWLFGQSELKLTEIEKGLPLVSLAGELVGAHQLLKLPLRHMFQDVLPSIRKRKKQKHQSFQISPRAVVAFFFFSLRLSGADLHVEVEPVVEVSTPEEMGEAQAEVKRAVLFTQAKQPEDVHTVLVPPGCELSEGTHQQAACLQKNPPPTHTHTKTHLKTFSLPEVRWQFTNPNDVPLK